MELSGIRPRITVEEVVARARELGLERKRGDGPRPQGGEAISRGARRLKLFDVVAVLDGSGEPEIRAGDVGTVVELLPHGGVEVEFVSRDGQTRHLGTLSADDVLVLNRNR